MEELIIDDLMIDDDDILIDDLIVECVITVVDGIKSYEDLDDLPSINGTQLIGNYDEIDPTVPNYVKEGKAVNEDNVKPIGILEVKEIWDMVFKN